MTNDHYSTISANVSLRLSTRELQAYILEILFFIILTLKHSAYFSFHFTFITLQFGDIPPWIDFGEEPIRVLRNQIISIFLVLVF